MESNILELHVVSIGVGDTAALPRSSLQAIQQADFLLGAEHHFDSISQITCKGEKHIYASPFSFVKQQVLEFTGVVVILASGDGLFYGIGQWVTQHFSFLKPTFHPNISSIQAACHLISKPWQKLTVLTAHGRPLVNIRSQLRNNRFYGLLTDKHSQPKDVALTLLQAGFDQSTLWICESIGSDNQRVTKYKLRDLINQPAVKDTPTTAPLHVTLFETAGKGNILPEFPGIPDTWFSTDGEKKGTGLLTKREVRVNILSLLQPSAEEVGWDIGAGCGGVAVEWARWNTDGNVYAVEYHPERLSHLEENRHRFGVANNLNIVKGMAPQALVELPNPQKVFIGGSGGELTEILTLCWQRLSAGGKLVIACVTENNKALTLDFVNQLPEQEASFDVTQISVSKGDSIASQLILRPQLPVLLVTITKTKEHVQQP